MQMTLIETVSRTVRVGRRDLIQALMWIDGGHIENALIANGVDVDDTLTFDDLRNDQLMRLVEQLWRDGVDLIGVRDLFNRGTGATTSSEFQIEA